MFINVLKLALTTDRSPLKIPCYPPVIDPRNFDTHVSIVIFLIVYNQLTRCSIHSLPILVHRTDPAVDLHSRPEGFTQQDQSGAHFKHHNSCPNI